MQKKRSACFGLGIGLPILLLVLQIQTLYAQTTKNGPIGVCYVEVNNNNILNTGAYTLQNGGQQLFDIAIVFAANINYDVSKSRAYLYSNNNVSKVLTNASTYIQPLKAKGMKVLLDVLGNHQGAGICNFTSRAAAKDFAQQIANTVKTYGLDGIDFDDEYADYGTNGTGQPNDSSFVMLVQEVRALLPDKIISFYYYGPAQTRLSWGGYRVGDYVNYSWNAIYGTFSAPNVPPLTNSQISPAAVWIDNTSTSTEASLASQTKSGGYGVFLWYDLHGTDESSYLTSATTTLYGDNAKLNGTPLSWTAGTSCDAPIGLSVSNLLGTSATLNWNAVGTNTYTVDYKAATDSVWVNAVTNTSSTSVTINGLSLNTVYDWRVKTNCSGTGSVYNFAPEFNSGSGPVVSPGPRSLYFNGVNQYANAGTINLSGSALSFEGWVKPSSFKTASPYISSIIGTEGGDTNAALIRFGDVNIANNKLQFVLSIGGVQKKLTSATSFSTNTWYHIAATYDGANMKLYVNGTLDASVAQTGTVNANGVLYIAKSWDDTRDINGTMDEMRIWKRALTQAEIQSNMCAVSPASTSLEAYWRFNDGSGMSAQDTTGHGHTASLVNMDNTNWLTDVPCATTPPVAGFTASPTTVSTGQTVNFTNTSSNATSYLWTFAGGTPSTSTSPNPTVTYSTTGTYTVKLVATNSYGSDSLIRTNYITVTAPSTYSVQMDGTNQYMNAGTINLTGSAVSLEGWVYVNAFKTTSPYISTVMGIESGTSEAELRFGDASLAANKLQFVLAIKSNGLFGSTTERKLNSVTVFNTNTWYHVAATYDGSTMKLYVNGVLDASASYKGSVSANAAFNIGYNYDLTRNLNGNVDELRVWTRALAQSEIQANMCSVSPTATSLEAYWKFNEGTGTSSSDLTGHSHNAAFVNMTTANWSGNTPTNCASSGGITTRAAKNESRLLQSNFSVSPNPVAKGSTVSINLLNANGQSLLIVYNANGTVVKQINIKGNAVRFSVAGLSSGVYYFTINNTDGKLIDQGKFIVQ